MLSGKGGRFSWANERKITIERILHGVAGVLNEIWMECQPSTMYHIWNRDGTVQIYVIVLSKTLNFFRNV